MSVSILALGLLSAVSGGPVLAPIDPHGAGKALEMLRDGNLRFVRSVAEHPNASTVRRIEVAKGQHPHTVVVTCSDSRVAPEIVFDQGLGDLFVVRVAGNVVDEFALGSIEYAVEHLGCSLVVVLGHERCGAVDAALKASATTTSASETTKAKSELAHGHTATKPEKVHALAHAGAHGSEGYVQFLIKAIVPNIASVRSLPGDKLDNAVRANIQAVTAQVRLAQGPIGKMWRSGELRVLGARYDLDSGGVEFTD